MNQENIQYEVDLLTQNTIRAKEQLAILTPEQKNAILKAMALALDARREEIKTANHKDIVLAQEKNLSSSMLERLQLNDARIDAMISGLNQVADLHDPVGRILREIKRPNGLLIKKIAVPIGVILIIYESRPNVTADVAGLCLKSGNAVILRGGSEALYSNQAIFQALVQGGMKAGMPQHSIQFITSSNHELIYALMQQVGKVDLVIPRGGAGLINAVMEHARVPVVKHYQGICHVYVDAAADINKAMAIVENAKCQRPGVCNAMETLLVHQDLAASFLPKIAAILQKRGVVLKGDAETQCILRGSTIVPVENWSTEYLDLILAIKVVPDLTAAIEHINTFGSHHSDAIVTEDFIAKQRFLAAVDSAAVYVNASTRFTDGAEFGMGAEIGISTDKLPVRGPMGLEELTTYKYIILGNGQIRT